MGGPFWGLGRFLQFPKEYPQWSNIVKVLKTYLKKFFFVKSQTPYFDPYIGVWVSGTREKGSRALVQCIGFLTALALEARKSFVGFR